MNPASRSTLILCLAVASAASILGYLGHNATGLIAVSFFGGYAASRPAQGTLILIALTVGGLTALLPPSSFIGGEVAFNQWFWFFCWLALLAHAAHRWRTFGPGGA